GSAPEAPIPGEALALPGSAELLGLLRQGEPPVVGYLRHGRLLLDLRTVAPEDDPELIATVGRALQAAGAGDARAPPHPQPRGASGAGARRWPPAASCWSRIATRCAACWRAPWPRRATTWPPPRPAAMPSACSASGSSTWC